MQEGEAAYSDSSTAAVTSHGELNGRSCGSGDAIAGPLTWSKLGWISEQKESGVRRSPSYFCRASAAATKP